MKGGSSFSDLCVHRSLNKERGDKAQLCRGEVMICNEEVRARVKAQAKNQCGYCRSLQKYVLGITEVRNVG